METKNRVALTEEERICSYCGGKLEVIETFQETWVLESKEYRMTIFSLQCLQCGRKYTIRKSSL